VLRAAFETREKVFCPNSAALLLLLLKGKHVKCLRQMPTGVIVEVWDGIGND
jgi:hypothetical protein